MNERMTAPVRSAPGGSPGNPAVSGAYQSRLGSTLDTRAPSASIRWAHMATAEPTLLPPVVPYSIPDVADAVPSLRDLFAALGPSSSMKLDDVAAPTTAFVDLDFAPKGPSTPAETDLFMKVR